MATDHHFVDILILLAAAVITVLLSQKLRLGLVFGYLVAGIVVGPHGFSLISDMESIHALAELGIVFLLFTVGLDMTLNRLKKIGLQILCLGILQIIVTVFAIGLVVLFSKYTLATAVIVGGALSMSSTAVVIQILQERNQLKTHYGQAALAVLLLQDLAVSPFLILLEVLKKDGGVLTAAVWSEFGLAAIKASCSIFAIFIVGRVFLRPLLRLVCEARSPEVFSASTLLVALGTSWITDKMNLSTAFGAFLAGVLISETEYRHQVQADIGPFRGILVGLFFTTVGMHFDLSLAMDNFLLVTNLTFSLLLGKSFLITILSKLFRFTIWRSLHLGGVLSQGGEFAFVLLGTAVLEEVVPAALGHLLILVVAASMAATPLYITLGSSWISFLEGREAVHRTHLEKQSSEGLAHVLIIGFGEISQVVAQMLKAYKIPYTILEMSPRRIAEGIALGEPIFYGDASLISVLKSAGVEKSRAVVLALNDPVTALRLADIIRISFPVLPIFSRVSNEVSATLSRKSGIDSVAPEAVEIGLRLASAVLHDENCKNGDAST